MAVDEQEELGIGQSFILVDGEYSAELEDLVDKTFYGVRLDVQTGQAFVDIIKGNEPISLPTEWSRSSADYINWVWTYNTLRFSFTEETGRLLMEVL